MLVLAAACGASIVPIAQIVLSATRVVLLAEGDNLVARSRPDGRGFNCCGVDRGSIVDLASNGSFDHRYVTCMFSSDGERALVRARSRNKSMTAAVDFCHKSIHGTIGVGIKVVLVRQPQSRP